MQYLPIGIINRVFGEFFLLIVRAISEIRINELEKSQNIIIADKYLRSVGLTAARSQLVDKSHKL